MGKVELGTRRIDLIETMEICQALGQEPAELVRELGRRLRS
jgi:hypothetical protein